MFQLMESYKKDNMQLTPISYKDELYFLPFEVGEQLGYLDVAHTIRHTLEKELDYITISGSDLRELKDLFRKGTNLPIAISSNVGRFNLLTEGGLYSLILNSNKESAKPFSKWVRHEVLPSIRKNGFYIEDTFANDPLVKSIQETLLLRKQQLRLEKQVEALQEKVKHTEKIINEDRQEIELQHIIQNQKITKLDEKISQIIGNPNYYTVVGFALGKRIPLSEGAAKAIGRRCSKLSKEQKIMIGTTYHSKYHHVNTYHVSVLETVFTNEGLI